MTLAGTVKTELLLASVTVLAAAAAWFNATVHVLDALLARLDGEQLREEICAPAVALSVNDWEVPFSDAVNVPV